MSQSSAPLFPSSVQCYISVHAPGKMQASLTSTVSTCRPPHKFVPTTTHVLLVCTPISTCLSPCTLALFWSVCRRADPSQCQAI